MKDKRAIEFGKRIKQVLKHLKLTQKESAARLGISIASLSEIENDKYKPGHDFFYNMVKEFKVNLYYLYFGKGDMFIGIKEGGKEVAADQSILLMANIVYLEHK